MSRDIHVRHWPAQRDDPYWTRAPQRTGYWLEEVARTSSSEPTAHQLLGDHKADVVIIGGGFAGLWVAYFLAEAAPNLHVAIIEADTCGSGASGRNAGFMTGWWDELDVLTNLYGEERAIQACIAIDESIAAIGDWCMRHDVDAWYRQGEYLAVATPGQHHLLDLPNVATAARLGRDASLGVINQDDLSHRIRSPLFGDAIRMPLAATIHPARLAKGLRRVVLEQGVTIYEHSPVITLRIDSRIEVVTTAGRLGAPKGVVTMGAWAGSLWPLRRLGITMASYIVATEPVPGFLAEIGWTSSECICDLRKALHYFRTTPDGRIIFGGGATRAVYRNARMIERSGAPKAPVAELRASMARFFPELTDVPFAAAWGGPVDFSPIHLPIVDTIDDDRLFFVYGFSGNGVAPSHAVAKELTKSILNASPLSDTWMPQISTLRHRFPMDPIRSLGARIIQEAIIRNERRQDHGQNSIWLSKFLSLPNQLGFPF